MADKKKNTCWYKANVAKRLFAFCTGAGVVICSVFVLMQLTQALDFLSHIRMVWNIIFGALIMLAQTGWKRLKWWVFKHFGFLSGWLGRGIFYLFVGFNIFGETWWTWTVGGVCIGLGFVELLFGHNCPESNAEITGTKTAPSELAGISAPATKPLAAANEPSFSVSIAQAPQVAAAAQSAANPFFGNAHLSPPP